MPRFDISQQRCPVCNRPGTTFNEEGRHDYSKHILYTVICQGCGSFEMDLGDFGTNLILNDQERISLSAIIRKYNDDVTKVYPLSALEQYKLNIPTAQAPLDVIDQIDSILIHTAKKAPYIGAYSPNESEHAWRARLHLPTKISVQTLMKSVQEQGLVYFHPQNASISVSLTISGWQRLREIRKIKSQGSQAFIAMWFHIGMNDAFSEGIVPALTETGYKPYRVDSQPNENRIDYEIIAQIKASRLLIADVTGEEQGYITKQDSPKVFRSL